ncbi:CerR family C-terminal domain-containing protein [Sphingomonas bacterium]|uniref:CerR family C-terminal domain-containing protein n=1 Tax=Sphingomonas bacterium TaxID=1895847 RepID=UPI0015772DCF|nr:CerR family C-terminal domain-containing protein [Sphingomonas bacterium]
MSHSRILDIAVSEFGRKGLEGASTRGIAAAAGTAMSSITYHFGGKEGLYAAAASHIDAEMADQMRSALSDGPVPEDAGDARAEIHRLLDRLAVQLITDRDAESSLFIMREQMHPTGAFDCFYRGTIGRMARRMVSLVGAATGAADRDARVTAMTLFGQVVVWRSSRALVDRLLDGPLDAGHEALVRHRIARNTDCILDRLSADQQEPQ